jgi:hypothetical protein
VPAKTKPRNPRTGSQNQPARKRKKQKETESRRIKTDEAVLKNTFKNYKKINIYSSNGFRFDIRRKLYTNWLTYKYNQLCQNYFVQ